MTKHLHLAAHLALAPFIGVLIGCMAWFMWTQEEILKALNEHSK